MNLRHINLRNLLHHFHDRATVIQMFGLATKTDLDALRSEFQTHRAETKADIQALRGDMDALRSDMKAMETGLRADMKAMHEDLKRDISRAVGLVGEMLADRVTVVDERYQDLPGRVSRLEDIVLKSA